MNPTTVLSQIVALLNEATKPECPDERMMEIAKQLRAAKSLALDQLSNLRTSYNDTWSNRQATEVQIFEASIQNTQCHRLESMINGEKPMPRVTLKEIQERQSRKTPKAPEMGWGIFSPDAEISFETQAVIDKLRALPPGQRDALLARAVQRYLNVELELEEGKEPDDSQMVTCSTALSNWFFDIIGAP